LRKVLRGRRGLSKETSGCGLCVDGSSAVPLAKKGGLLIQLGADAQERILHHAHAQRTEIAGAMIRIAASKTEVPQVEAHAEENGEFAETFWPRPGCR
jgi:hypothetical protein